MRKPRYRGILYSVKVGDAQGGVHSIFSAALIDSFAVQGKKLPQEMADQCARFLIDQLEVGASAQANTPPAERYNAIIRAGNAVGIPMIHELEKMLKDAKAKSKENDVARGRMRGLAQALALIRSPETYLSSKPLKKLHMIQTEESR